MRVIETERLILRNVCEKDKEDMFSLLSDENTCMDDGGYHAYTSIKQDEFISVFRSICERDEHYMIISKKNNRGIGLLHVMDVKEDNNAREIGYIIHVNERRKGYAKEAVANVINDLKIHENIERIICVVYNYNVASIKTVESLGFVYKKTLEETWYHPKHGETYSLCYVYQNN